MKMLIDECIDERFRHSFASHDCQTARFAGFAGLQNGELLDAAERAHFEVFLTLDQGLPHQQNLAGRRIAIIILEARTSRLQDLLSLAPECLAVLPIVKPGELFTIHEN